MAALEDGMVAHVAYAYIFCDSGILWQGVCQVVLEN